MAGQEVTREMSQMRLLPAGGSVGKLPVEGPFGRRSQAWLGGRAHGESRPPGTASVWQFHREAPGTVSKDNRDISYALSRLHHCVIASCRTTSVDVVPEQIARGLFAWTIAISQSEQQVGTRIRVLKTLTLGPIATLASEQQSTICNLDIGQKRKMCKHPRGPIQKNVNLKSGYKRLSWMCLECDSGCFSGAF